MIEKTRLQLKKKRFLFKFLFVCQISCFCECVASTMYKLIFSLSWKTFSGNILTILTLRLQENVFPLNYYCCQSRNQLWPTFGRRIYVTLCVPDSASWRCGNKTATAYKQHLRNFWLNSNGRTTRGGPSVRCRSRVLQLLNGKNQQVKICYKGRRIHNEQKSILQKLLGNSKVLNFQMMPKGNTKTSCNYRCQWFTSPVLNASGATTQISGYGLY
jgi:hypothetical protein